MWFFVSPFPASRRDCMRTIIRTIYYTLLFKFILAKFYSRKQFECKISHYLMGQEDGDAIAAVLQRREEEEHICFVVVFRAPFEEHIENMGWKSKCIKRINATTTPHTQHMLAYPLLPLSLPMPLLLLLIFFIVYRKFMQIVFNISARERILFFNGSFILYHPIFLLFPARLLVPICRLAMCNFARGTFQNVPEWTSAIDNFVDSIRSQTQSIPSSVNGQIVYQVLHSIERSNLGISKTNNVRDNRQWTFLLYFIFGTTKLKWHRDMIWIFVIKYSVNNIILFRRLIGQSNPNYTL